MYIYFLICLVCIASTTTVTVTSDWNNIKHESKLIPTFQVVLNPLVMRGSHIYKNVWKYVSELDTDIVRFQAC